VIEEITPYQGVIQEFETGGVLEVGGGCCERSEQKKFSHPPRGGVFFTQNTHSDV
jgi:hypothetical protein